MRNRTVGLVVACLLVLSAQRIFHRLMRNRLESSDAPSSSWNTLINIVPLKDAPTEVETNEDNEREYFAPIIIGAGQGTTGTHLFAEVTCELGFVTLHYAIGCVPRNAISVREEARQLSIVGDSDSKNGTIHENATEEEKAPCPMPIDHFEHPYDTLIQHQRAITRIYNQMVKQADPKEFRKKILHYLESIIFWGKKHKITLALHDTPYPFLMPDILRLVQKHYGFTKGGENVTMKPIIILSERDPSGYAESRIRGHGGHTWICKPTKNQIGRPIINDSPIVNSSSWVAGTINSITLKGGAYDIISCLNRLYFAENGTKLRTHQMDMSDIFYSYKQAVGSQQRQFIIDTMESYQDTVKNSAIFSYNMFEKENRTTVHDLAAEMKKSMNEALVKKDGKMLLVKDGINFLGIGSLFDNIAESGREEVQGVITHRRRHHGDSYGEGFAPNDVRIEFHGKNNTNMVPIHMWNKMTMSSLGEVIRKQKRRCKT
mmetsp:Transcript_12537/g.26701  ORF Transcript_12537/g.26701 Transcript_12537/m.26701 type:complete len:488 (+) Transcript_12537:147-1610(+)